MESSSLQVDSNAAKGLYRKLAPGHFRLIQYDGETDNRFYFSLTEHRIDDAPEYVALSYTWGAPEEARLAASTLSSTRYAETRTIMINGHANQARQNLYEFFEHMEADDQIRRYWIDALCINQEDDIEKTEQVNRMDDIYKNANFVLVWFGSANDDTPKVIRMIDQLSTACQSRTLEELAAFVDPLDPKVQKDLGLEDATIEAWHALSLFFRRTWLFRLWTLQEAALARDIVCRCGTYNIPWTSVEDISSFLYYSPIGNFLGNLAYSRGHNLGEAGGGVFEDRGDGLISPTYTHVVMRSLASGNVELMNDLESLFKIWYNVSDIYACPAALLEFFIARTSITHCADPRDKIFGILGMVKEAAKYGDGPGLDLVANYHESTVDVYIKVMSLILSSTGTLTTLSRAVHHQRSSLRELPSWVNDFSQIKTMPLLEVQRLQGLVDITPYDASKQSIVGFAVRERALHLHHCTLSKVTHVGESWAEWGRELSFERTAQLLIARRDENVERELAIDDIWKTMLCDVRTLFSQDFSDLELRLGFRKLLLLICWSRVAKLEHEESSVQALSKMESLSLLASLDDSGTICSPAAAMKITDEEVEEILSDTLPFQLLVTKIMAGRRLFLLDDGRIGLGAESVEPGDVLSIVADGGRTPFLFRKAGTGSNEWTLISEAYVRGIMYGEAVEQMESEGKRWEEICIV